MSDDALTEYKRFRSIQRRQGDTLLKLLDVDDVRRATHLLGLGGRMSASVSETDMSVLADFAIFEIRDAGGRNAVDRLFDTRPPTDGSDEWLGLQAMRTARYAVVKVTASVPRIGVYFEDVLSDLIGLLVDVGFSQTAKPGVLFGTRLTSPLGTWYMTGGAALPVTPAGDTAMRSALQKFEKANGRRPEASEISAVLIPAFRKSGAAEHVGYADLEEFEKEGAARVIASRAAANDDNKKIGRNDPCTCGSGKKFKKCCGSARA